MAIVKKRSNIETFRAGDLTWLCELLHPSNDKIGTNFSLAHAYLEAGEASLPHKLIKSTETYYFMEGRGTISIDNEVFSVEKDSLVHVAANAIQSVQNTGSEKLVFLCVVSPPWSETDEEILA